MGIVTSVEELPHRPLPVPDPASALFFPQVLISHKYHLLQTLSQGLLPENPTCSRRQRNILSSVTTEKRKWVYVYTAWVALYQVSLPFPDFSGPPPSSVSGGNRVYPIGSSLESFLLCSFSAVFCFPSLLLALAIMVITII